jgi:hypothetical protein
MDLTTLLEYGDPTVACGRAFTAVKARLPPVAAVVDVKLFDAESTLLKLTMKGVVNEYPSSDAVTV